MSIDSHVHHNKIVDFKPTLLFLPVSQLNIFVKWAVFPNPVNDVTIESPFFFLFYPRCGRIPTIHTLDVEEYQPSLP